MKNKWNEKKIDKYLKKKTLHGEKKKCKNKIFGDGKQNRIFVF